MPFPTFPRKAVVLWLAGGLFFFASGVGKSVAQDFPKKPIRIIVTADAGEGKILKREESPRTSRNIWE